jgi:hypothetical protein
MLRRVWLASVVCVCLAVVTPRAAGDFAGKWEGAIKMGDGSDLTLTFEFTVDGSVLNGSVESQMGKAAIKNGKIVDADNATFVVEFDGNVITHEAKIAGDEITISAHGPWGDNQYTVKRAAPAAKP